MKQTNNAIKFLMAQYRAIFKNANIAMLAAIAASALAAGQAQAAAVTVNDWDKLETGNYNGAAASDGDKKIEITGKTGTMENSKGFEATLVSGAATIKGATGFETFTVTGEKAAITLKANQGANPTLAIGDGADEWAIVKIKEFTNQGGKLTIKGGDAAENLSKLEANAISIGHAKDTLQADAAVVLDKNSVLGSADTETFEILKSGSLQFSGANATAISKKGIVLNGGTISTADAAGVSGKITNGLSVQDGKLEIAAGTNGSTLAIDKLTVSNRGAVVVSGGTVGGKLNVESVTVQSGTVTVSGGAAAGKLTVSNDLNVSGGTVDLATGTSGGELEVQGKTNFTGGKLNIAESGAFTIKDNATFAKGTIGNINANGAFKVDTSAKSVDLNIAQAELKSLLGGAFTAAGNNNFNLVLTDAGENLNLLDSKLVDDNGVSKIAMASGKGVANIKTTGTATYLKGKFNSATGYDFNSMTVGTSDAFSIEGKASVTVHSGITVSGDKTQTNLTVKSGTLVLDGSGKVNAKTLTVSGANSSSTEANLNVTGKWSVDNLTLNSGTTTLNDAELTIAGNLTSAAGAIVNSNNSKIFVDGENSGLKVSDGKITLKNASELHVDAADVISGTSINGTNLAKNKLDSDANSKLILKSAEAVKMTKDQFKQFASDTGFKGIIDGITLTDHNVSGTQTLDKLVTNGTAGQEDVTASVGNTAVSGNYTVGNAQLSEATDTSLELGAGGNLTLVDASIGTNNKGNFVSKKDGTVADVVMKDSNTLTLAGSGNIGSVTTDTAGKGQVTFGTASSKGNVTVQGSLGADNKALAEVNTNGSNVTVSGGDVYAQNINLNGGSLSLNTGKKVVIGAGAAGLDSTITGNLSAGEFNVSGNSTGDINMSNNAVVDVDVFNASATVNVNVGKDDVENGGATLLADTFVLKGASLIVDPDYGQEASKVVIQNITDKADKPEAQTIDGKVYVGANSVVSIGYTQAEFDDVMADYLVQNGGFSDQQDGNAKNGVKNALVLNKSITIANDAGIVVDASKKGTELTGALKPDTVVLADGAALIISDNAFGANKSEAAIKFADTSNSGSIALTGAAAKVVLVGDFDANDTELKLAVKSGGTVADGLTNVKVEYAGGLLEGNYDPTKGTFALEFNQDKADAVYEGISRPVGDAIIGKLKGEFKDKSAAGYGLLSDLIAAGNYKAVDAAAHAATYAGAQQAAVAAVTTMADAMFGRVGAVGVEAASISATGSQANGGVWLTPMYKSVDSDGFNAEGASYGADVDLSGVAFGTDTVNGNMRFGAVFNIGSGDAEGKGNGNGLKDEFDYHGFGIYSAMGFGNFALVGDASMTVISHEVEGLGLRGKADTTAVTMGVTGQYTVATPVVDVTPHLGARFIRLNTDNYDLISANGVEATTDFDVQNVFSVPLGVTLSKGFVTGGWTLAPSADLTIAFNSGDTEAKSNTFIAGKNIGLNTEVLDEVTYGLTLGLGAQYGAFGTSFGINYTGSSNTDSFGVNAQARYMF